MKMPVLLIAGIAILLFILISGGYIVSKKTIRTDGVSTVGTVKTRSSERLKKQTSLTYFLHVSYITLDGKAFTRKIDVSKEKYDSTTEGDEVNILYLPKNPIKAVLKN